jgi:CelD/BcsL family acetyltransferase involved in cellulose biosynthesis
MTLACETVDPLRDERWQRFVQSSPDGRVFHHRDWLALLHEQYRYPVQAQCVSDAGEILAGLPLAYVRSALTGRRLVAVPFSDACGPVQLGGACDDARAAGAPLGDPPGASAPRGDPRHADPRREAALDLLLHELREVHLRRHVDVEIRAGLPGIGRPGDRYCVHEAPLEGGLAAVGARFAKMTTRSIARARREGVEVVRAEDAEALREFYRLHLATRRRQGVPTQPRRFLERFEQLFERSLGFVLLARVEGRTIAASVFLSFNGVLTYKYGASSRADLQYRPNHAIFAEAIRIGCEQGMHTLDMGRTDLDNEGLRAFKRSWGAREQILTYTLLSARAARPALPRARRVLHTTISRTPALTGRMIGATLYRHFG